MLLLGRGRSGGSHVRFLKTRAVQGLLERPARSDGAGRELSIRLEPHTPKGHSWRCAWAGKRGEA